MRTASVDIGTNSIRLLVVEDGREMHRDVQVVGLGRNAGDDGSFDPESVARTVAGLRRFGEKLREMNVGDIRAVATAATRRAPDPSAFLAAAADALGAGVQVITGEEEAALSFRGAVADAPGSGPYVVVDIGGGSTEFVWEADGGLVARSVDVGSVWLTEHHLPDRPAAFDQLLAAVQLVDGLFALVDAPTSDVTVVGVGGTWTSLSAIAQGLEVYDRAMVHHSLISRRAVDRLMLDLASRTVEQTAAIPSLDPGRAPVILAGAVIAREAMRRLLVEDVVVSEHDLLDALVADT